MLKDHQTILRRQAAEAALKYVTGHSIIGIGTGRTTNCFIELLSSYKSQIDACVASSRASADLLKKHGFVVLDLNVIDKLEIYFDGADEVNHHHQMIKGGGGALTWEKIVASAAKTYVCMIEAHKWVPRLGQFPVAVEVLPIARSLVARALVHLGGDPVYRQGFVTDSGNIILDTHHLPMESFETLEHEIKHIPGVVETGLFMHRKADIVLKADSTGVRTSSLLE
ncbi:MAG TPA: ribose-5-phosphate isomerase RpiA [Legionellaceae bacterium]|nr:ribose-5-phosphate isomerase RpiA [Legionellaceae bacterium]